VGASAEKHEYSQEGPREVHVVENDADIAVECKSLIDILSKESDKFNSW